MLVSTVLLAALGLAALGAPGWRVVTWAAMAALVGAYLAAPTVLRRYAG